MYAYCIVYVQPSIRRCKTDIPIFFLAILIAHSFQSSFFIYFNLYGTQFNDFVWLTIYDKKLNAKNRVRWDPVNLYNHTQK